MPLAILSSPTSYLSVAMVTVPAPSKGKPHCLARSTGAAGRPHLGVVLLLLFLRPGTQEPATSHSDHHPWGAAEEGSGCLLSSSFASVWHSLWGPK